MTASGPFEGRVVVLTGASSGVGDAFARALCCSGARLATLGRTPWPAAACARNGNDVRFYAADFAGDDAQLIEATTAIRRDFGQVAAVIHCAGQIVPGRIADAALQDLDVQYRVNTRAPYLISQQLLPVMREDGDIVFINSSAGRTAGCDNGQYAASKHALVAIADSLRAELNERGIRVLTVFLGRTATPMQQAVHAAEGRAYTPERLIQPGDVANAVLALLALPRTVECTEIALRPLAKPSPAREAPL